MAKGQQRSNKETKKPKKDKPKPGAEAATASFAKGTLSPTGKKK